LVWSTIVCIGLGVIKWSRYSSVMLHLSLDCELHCRIDSKGWNGGVGWGE
jgi:hypothetical protein